MNRFTRTNETSISKLETRELRIQLSRAFLRLPHKALHVVSLPGFYGCYEKEVFPVVRAKNIPVSWNAFERKTSLWNRPTNPFRCGRMTVETPGVRVFRSGDVNVAYANQRLFVEAGEDVPVLLDGDFCGCLDSDIMENCIDKVTPGSLVMLTFYTRRRHNLPFAPSVQRLIAKDVKEGYVSTRQMRAAYRTAVEQRLAARGVSFTNLLDHGYHSSEMSPMVLLAWHLVPNSRLRHLNLGLTSES